MTHPEYSPYIYLAFYMGVNPATYQKQVVRYPPTSDAFVHVRKYGRFEFRAIDWAHDTNRHNTLLIDLPQDIPGTFKLESGYQTVALPDGSVFLGIVSLK